LVFLLIKWESHLAVVLNVYISTKLTFCFKISQAEDLQAEGAKQGQSD